MDDEMTLREALNLLVGVYVREETRLQDAAIALVESIGRDVIAGMGIEIERVDGQTFKVSVYLAGDLPAGSVYETR